MSHQVNGIDEIDGGGSKRNKAFEMARAQMQKNAEARKQKEASVDLDMGTGSSKNFAYDNNQTQKDQETFHESYDNSGSISGGYNAGSTINQSNNSSGGGGANNNNSGNSQRSTIKLESKSLKKGNIPEKLSLFDI